MVDARVPTSQTAASLYDCICSSVLACWLFVSKGKGNGGLRPDGGPTFCVGNMQKVSVEQGIAG
uniref:Uncharacterized protein n=1 Tax=Arundo donax TaxID=35708 RepID=A0A0A9HMX8_ARUDO